MQDKKIIEKDDVKENNPNDDEEIIKNNDEPQTGDNINESAGSEKNIEPDRSSPGEKPAASV